MPLQGVTNGCALTQGVASLALGYALVGLSARLELNPKLYLIILLLAVFSFLQGVFWKIKIQASPNDRFVFNMLIIGCRGGKNGYLMILAKVSRDTWQSNT